MPSKTLTENRLPSLTHLKFLHSAGGSSLRGKSQRSFHINAQRVPSLRKTMHWDVSTIDWGDTRWPHSLNLEKRNPSHTEGERKNANILINRDAGPAPGEILFEKKKKKNSPCSGKKGKVTLVH